MLDPYQAREVRDGRTPTHFDTDIRLITQWLQILQAEGLALYSIYLCLATMGGQTPGIRRLAAVLGISTRTVDYVNRVLVWSGLIQIILPAEPGSPNRYEIQDVPEASPDRLQAIQVKALRDAVMASDYATPYREKLLTRLAAHRPWQPPGAASSPAPHLNGARPAAAPASPAHPLVERLEKLSFYPDLANQLINQHGPENVSAWLSIVEAADPAYFTSGPRSYLMAVLGQEPRPLPDKKKRGKRSNGLSLEVCSACSMTPCHCE
jgi:hypothetical protein